ncbi:O-antigen ligase family protein [Saccharicrinis aurantiacus]|uniref:O-antigen ligase family protein n=1 Tax=Saccharicrinis aurantiacus TaxID=1849719 RepID=UPI00248F7C00|nr:O-antigen ligase family protein [Saccharicrinis aurantiacus]
MTEIINLFKQYNNIWTALFVMIVGGVFAGIAGACIVLLFYIATQQSQYKDELLLVLFLCVFFLGDNFSGRLGFANNLRFVSLGLSLVYFSHYNIFDQNLGNKILPFTIIAVGITLLYSPLGTLAVLRAVAYWLMALVVFKAASVSFNKTATQISYIILFFIALYFLVNILLYFVPIASLKIYVAGRFSGLMANPNGLGILATLCYPFTDLFRRRKEIEIHPKLFIAIKLGILFIAILTGSRNTLLSILIYETAMKFSKNKGMLFVSLAIFSLLYYSISVNDIIALIYYLDLGEYLRVDSLLDGSGRTQVWEVAWEEVKRSPWLGNGMMYDNHYIAEYRRVVIGPNAERAWSGIWNSYLSLLLNVGIVGVATYAYFVKEMFKAAQLKDLAFAFILMTAFSAITESWMAASMNAFTPMFFLYWAVQAQPMEGAMGQEVDRSGGD